MAALLAQIVGSKSPVTAYAATLLAAFDQGAKRQSGKGTNARDGAAPVPSAPRSPTPLPLVEPLSARELEILGLIAAGHSNQAIAATLIVAVGTVKKHINNIFGKLEVQSRTQALVRARELNLL